MNSVKDILSRQSFREQYKSDAWGNRSREVIASHAFCNSCRRSREEVRLNVHHAVYRRGVALADHDTSDLVVLCENCHELIHAVNNDFREVAANCNASNIARIMVALKHQLKLEGELRVLERLVR